MKRGQQRKIPAPGTNVKRHESAATDWRTGDIVRVRSEHRDAGTFCRLIDQCVARSVRRKRWTLVIVDNAHIHRPETSKAAATLLARHGKHLKLVYVPAYAPEEQLQEKFWKTWRKHVTHDHQRRRITQLEKDSDRHFAWSAHHKDEVLRTIASPYARIQNRKTQFGLFRDITEARRRTFACRPCFACTAARYCVHRHPFLFARAIAVLHLKILQVALRCGVLSSSPCS